MNNLVRFFLVISVCATASLHATVSYASVIIQGTRVIYPAEQQEVVVRLESKGARPSLIQAWLDDGDKSVTPTTAQAPFSVVPPIFRIEPKTQQALRLRYTGEPLPADRESLYWLNVMEIQPKTVGADGRNLIELSFRTRLRVYFRPSGLPYARNDAAKKLSWTLVAYQGGYALEVLNRTPYHLPMSSVELLTESKQKYRIAKPLQPNDNLLLPSGDIKRFMLPGLQSKPSGPLRVEFTETNDFGAKIKHSIDLQS